MMNDEMWMQKAIEYAKRAEACNEVPVGALIVRGDRLIAAAFNTKEHSKDPTDHAEMQAIRQAARALGGWRLCDCTLYATLEPCPMCAGAAVLARIPRIVFGAYDKKAGALGTVYNLSEGKLNHTPVIKGGVLQEECAALLREYFRKKRKQESNGMQ